MSKPKKNPKTTYLQSKQVAVIMNITRQTALVRIRAVKDALGFPTEKTRRASYRDITVEEFCNYYAMDVNAVMETVNNNSK